MPLEASSNLAIGQWSGSPRLRALIDAAIAALETEVMPSVERIQKMLRIDDAEGVWLDYLGLRLGIRRPATTDPATDPRFGFDMAGTPFDQRPFRGDAANDATYPVPDEVFRRMVRARALLVFGDGTFQTFARAVREIDPSAATQDRRDMTVRVVTDQRPFLQLAEEANALPRTAGVRIVYADRGRFGFSDQPTSDQQSGANFDHGAFTPDG